MSRSHIDESNVEMTPLKNFSRSQSLTGRWRAMPRRTVSFIGGACNRWVRKRQGRHRGIYIVANKTEGQLTDQMAEAIDECRRWAVLRSEGGNTLN